ncbi:9018_t:CDS:2 [Gigaspora rosea]|nr:9018_t:CDS:2 [Gigaspora rosea]
MSQKKLSRHVHYNKKCRLEKELNTNLPVDYNVPIPTTPIIGITIRDFIFDPNQIYIISNSYQIFLEFFELGFYKILYIEKEWMSVPLGPSDRIVSKGVKSQEKVFADELLIETLVRETVLVNRVELPKILPDFLALINNKIIKVIYVTKVKSKTKDLNEQLWLSLG